MPVFVGLLFATLWASASIATKIGIRSAEPLILADLRFLLAGSLLIAYCHLPYRFAKQYALPKRAEWRSLTLLGLLNTTLYLGCFFLALKSVSAGLATLFIAANPLLITIFSAVWLKRPVQPPEWTGILLGTIGLIVTTVPTLQSNQASLAGVLLLLGGMISFSIGSICIARSQLALPTVVVNAWQVMIGGVCLAPIALVLDDITATRADATLYWALLWLTIPVSIGAMQLWFYLLKQDAVQAGIWLLLTPVLGYAFSALVLQEPITIDVIIGTTLVILGLYRSKTGLIKPA